MLRLNPEAKGRRDSAQAAIGADIPRFREISMTALRIRGVFT